MIGRENRRDVRLGEGVDLNWNLKMLNPRRERWRTALELSHNKKPSGSMWSQQVDVALLTTDKDQLSFEPPRNST
jgi:hypothetical protein